MSSPGPWSDVLWRLKPNAPDDFARLGAAAGPLMLLVALACAAAAIGLWTQRRWGRRLAVAILVVNLVGDTLNAVLRDDWRTLLGLPIGGVILLYLLRPEIRRWLGLEAREGI